MISYTLRIAALFTLSTLLIFSPVGHADSAATPHGESNEPITTLSGIPLDGMSLTPGETISFQVDSNPSQIRVSARPNPISGSNGTLRRDGDIYRFTAPQTGAFAGPYPIDIHTPESDHRTVRLRVPPVAKVESPILLPGGDPLSVEVQGVIPGYQFLVETLEPRDDIPSLNAHSLALDPSLESSGHDKGIQAGRVAALPDATPGDFRIRLSPQDGRYEPVIVDNLRVVATDPVRGKLHTEDGQPVADARLVVSSNGASSSATTDENGRFRLLSPTDRDGNVHISGPDLIPRAFDLQGFRQTNSAGPITMAAATARIDTEIVGLAAGDRIELQLVPGDDSVIPGHGPASIRGDRSEADTISLTAREGASYTALRISGRGYRDQEIALPGQIATANDQPPVVVQLESVPPEVTIGDISINKPQGEAWGTPNAVVTVFIETAQRPGSVTIRYSSDPDNLSSTDGPVSYPSKDDTVAAANVRLHPLECGTQYYAEATATNDLGEESNAVAFDFKTASCTGSDPSAFSCSLTSRGTGPDPIPLILIVISVAGLSARARRAQA